MMNRFERVVEILNEAVGGDSVPVGFHGAFWRGVSRNEFVAKKIFGLDLITVGNGSQSNLVRALKGETPFGADTGNPEASFNRMPSGLPPVPPDQIAFIEKWINEGAPEDPFDDAPPLTWRKTNAPTARRHDDVWFFDPLIGWAVNSDGNILKTIDGGANWGIQKSMPGVYLRCVGFADASRGWVGTLTPNRRLFSTIDGGANWSTVTPLPAEAPIAVCGLSVVNDQIVFASGTNRPSDVPRMMKTHDGGSTWQAWDMSAHASILIDTFFLDSQHGWVVGGKANDPTPTTRDKLKPVVLETTDGGITWTNRLAGMQEEFPFGEWGWKIQFLSGQVGFVSLENFSDAAILKTVDGGQTWRRLSVNDPQGNVNLEGVGFVDERQGWVGGWGSADFMKGFTSGTTDGGENWVSANEVGLFINRFRFFGNPVELGYASGDTIYKYSSRAVDAPSGITAQHDAARTMLPETQMAGTTSGVSINVNLPPGARRVTLHVWDWYGVEVGCIWDEVDPVSGEQVLVWDGVDSRGDEVAPGQYVVRLTVDSTSVSSFLKLRLDPTREISARSRAISPRVPYAPARQPRLTMLSALMAEPTHDLNWLRNALQIAIQLELSTLPPYLTARWTIKNLNDPVAQSINEIRGEEMLHFGLACNLLVAVGGTPLLADDSVVPHYPGPLPGGVRPGLEVTLRKLTREQARVFMEIEYPQGGPVAISGETFDSIGEFYEAVLAAFKDLNPTLTVDRQLEGPLALFKITSLERVEEAIRLINLQGEGSSVSPEESPGDLAHHYRFGEIHHGKKLLQSAEGNWEYNGADVPLPDVYNMADIPAGGYQQSEVPDIAVWDLISRFDQHFSNMLRLLQQAWTHGEPSFLSQAIGQMFAMHSTGRNLIKIPISNGKGNYGPCFRLVN